MWSSWTASILFKILYNTFYILKKYRSVRIDEGTNILNKETEV